MICREQCLRRRWGGEGKGGEREEAGGEGQGQRTGRGAHRIGEEMEKKKGRGERGDEKETGEGENAGGRGKDHKSRRKGAEGREKGEWKMGVKGLLFG